MANIVRIELKCEQSVNIIGKELRCSDDPITVEAYITCDGVRAWIGSVENYKDLMKIAGPERLNQTLLENLSDVELEIIEPALACSDFKYKIGDDWFTMIEDCTMSEEN